MQVQFIHKHDPKAPKGGQTIAMECNDTDFVVAIAMANCCPKDNFNKTTGRNKSRGRLKSQHYRIDLDPAIPRKDFINHILNDKGAT